MPMSATETVTPDWLTKRSGELRRGVDELTWLVLLSGSALYRLAVVPAQGKFTCVVNKAVSGRRIDKGTESPTADAALAAGLDELRQALGW